MKFAILLLAAISGTGAPPPAELDDIREATFRYMFTKNASGLQQNAGVYCLSIDGKDPGTEFIGRFSQHKPPVKKASECKNVDLRGVQDHATGADGLIFRIDKVEFVNDSTVDVSGGYYEAGLSASGNVYRLEKRSGAWKVVSDVMLWIS